jgi:hypothetical protein
MKRVFVLFVTLLALLGAAVVPAAAVPTEDLAALAAHMPGNSLMYAAIRTDDAYIETLDGLIAKLVEAIPNGEMPTTIREALDDAASSFGGTFNEVFRPWFGDTAAISIRSYEFLMDNDPDNDIRSFTAAVAITDPAGATAYFDDLVERGDGISQGGGVYAFSVNRSDVIVDVSVTDDVVLFGNLVMTREAALSENPLFTDSLANLPENDYNILLWINYPSFVDSVMSTMMNMPEGMGQEAFQQQMDMMGSLLGSIGGAAVGFTILDGRTLTIDLAANVDLEMLASSMGVDPAMLILPPINVDFANRALSGTPLYVQGTNLAASFAQLPMSLAQAMPGLSGNPMMTPEEAQEMVDEALQQVDFVLRGATGLTLEDITSWMTSDYALYLTLAPSVMEAESMFQLMMGDGLPVDFALIVDASGDVEAAADVVTGLGSAFELLSTQINSAGGAEASVEAADGMVTLRLITRDVPFPIEIAVASNDEVFVLGTMRAVEAALNNNGGLLNDPAYREALGYALPNGTSFAYAAGGGLLPLAAVAGADDEEMGAGLEALFTLLNSSIISGAYEDGLSRARATITLPQ